MKKTITILGAVFMLIASCLLPARSFAQAPQAFKYQTIVRDNTGTILANINVSFRISMMQGSATGPNVYSETQTATTNQFGLANLKIGAGIVVSGNFTTISWGSNNYYVKIEFDQTGGNNYTVMGTSQLLSVPYALFAQNSASGAMGATGAIGSTGATGLQGIAGTTGATGAIGATGFVTSGTLAGNTSYWNGTQWVLNSSNIYNNGGNVGVGNSNPSEKLDVTGNVRFSGAIMPNNAPGMNGTVLCSTGANTSPIWLCSPGYLNCNNNPADGCETNIVSDNNNCGFCGNACPADKICENGVCTAIPSWNITGNAGTVNGTNFIGTTDAVDWVVKTNNLERVRILSAGNIGINNATPAAKLHIKGNSDATQFIIQANLAQSNTNPLFKLQNSAGTDLLWLNSDDVTNTFLGLNTGRVNNSVGGAKNNTFIGSDAGYSNTTGTNNTANGFHALYSNTTGGNNTAFGDGADVASGGLTNATAIGYNAVVSTSNSIVLGNGANIGIGTSAPLSTLDVNGAISTKIKTITTNTILDNTAEVWYATPLAAITLTLPAASGVANRRYIIVNQSLQTITIGSYINMSGIATTIVPTNSSIEIISDGTNWLLIK